jgi:hypothetical protein
MLMTELLFPTQFPIHNDIKDSHTYYINGDRRIGEYMLSMIKRPFERKYSYIKHNGKIYTTRTATCVNDILNHSIYRKLIDLWNSTKNPKNSTMKMKNDYANTLRTLITDSNTQPSYLSFNGELQKNIDKIKSNAP